MLKKRMMKRRRQLLSSDEEIDPMIYAVNMVDCMLVLAVGFLVFIIIMNSATPESKVVDIKIGKELNITPQTTSSSSTNGLTPTGTVYTDPKTGKMILVNNT